MIYKGVSTAVLDACVLYPASIRDILLRLVKENLYRPKWTEKINNEWKRNLLASRDDLNTVCLISALDFHEMTTEISHKVHIALPRTNRDPKLDHPPIKVYRFSGRSLTEGIESHEVDGVEIKVYNPAKTIADYFKFRNKIGLDIAIEALKDGTRENKASFTEIEKFAKICRVQNVIRPYVGNST